MMEKFEIRLDVPFGAAGNCCVVMVLLSSCRVTRMPSTEKFSWLPDGC